MVFRFFKKTALLILLLLIISSCDNGKEDPSQPHVEPSPYTSLTWKLPGADATIPRFEAQGLALNGKLYVFGGFYTGDPILATLQSDVYDLMSNTWTPLAPLPEKLSHAGQAADGKFIYLAGGFVGDHPAVRLLPP